VGLNFERVIKRRNEMSTGRMGPQLRVPERLAGRHLNGLADIRQAERIRLRPYFLGGAESLDAVAVRCPRAASLRSASTT